MMKWLCIELDLLTGRYVAADPSNRESNEWPPHPGRLFMALAATCFELGGSEAELNAIEWLEIQPPPTIQCGHPHVRSKIGVYVPVNDKNTDKGGALQSAPGLSRSRQERFFPTTIPETPTIQFYWPVDDEALVPIETLDQICGETIRVGHSSSLVRATAYLISNGERSDETAAICRHDWIPARPGEQHRGSRSLRVTTSGDLRRLIIDGKREKVDRFVELSERIESSKGKDKTSLKETFEAEFGVGYSANVRPPEPTPATIRNWQSYVMDGERRESIATQPRDFYNDGAVLTILNAPRLSLADTLMIAKQLRNVILSTCTVDPIPSWLSGHDQQNKPSRDPHIAVVPLAYVDTKFADGHLMGMAILNPRQVSLSEIGRCLSPILYQDNGDPKDLLLNFQRFDTVTLRLEERAEPAKTLRIDHWTRPSRIWSSITPVVLDRFPKANRQTDRQAWHAEVVQIIRRSCEFAGIPIPIAIDIDTTSFVRGVPRAVAKSATRRSGQSHFGEGFPRYTTSSDKPPRVQVHVRLEFDRPHHGPVLLGAGRFSGYGFCYPCRVPQSKRKSEVKS